jgi:GNAT superfamily N-acetyltransferase
VRIRPLAEHPELVDTVARWHWDEWGGESVEDWAQNLRRHAENGIPTTFVALESGRPVGSVTLTEHDMPGHLSYGNFGPWIAGTYVTPEARGTGAGAALMRHAIERADEWGIPRLYLYTEAARPFYEHLGWSTLDETEYGGGTVAVMTIATDVPFPLSMPATRQLSQRISQGDGIAVIVEVDDLDGARQAENDGAMGVAVTRKVDGIRDATTLPILWIADGTPADADAVAVRPKDGADHELEAVAIVRDEEDLELALERLDPEIFLLVVDEDDDADPLDAVLELLPDVPAGKLAIAHVDVATREELLALERAGIDAVLVPAGSVRGLTGAP